MGRTISLGHLQLLKPGQDERKRRVSSGVYPELKWAEVSTHASGGSSDAHGGRDEAPPTGTRCHVVLEAEGPNIKALAEPVPPAGSERERVRPSVPLPRLLGHPGAPARPAARRHSVPFSAAGVTWPSWPLRLHLPAPFCKATGFKARPRLGPPRLNE